MVHCLKLQYQTRETGEAHYLHEWSLTEGRLQGKNCNYNDGRVGKNKTDMLVFCV